MVYLSEELWFPEPSLATPEGILALGGDLSASRLLLAYQSGIFPWYNEGEPIIWWSPDPRMVLFPNELKVSKSLRQLIKKERFRVTYNQAFEQVIAHCSKIPRPGQEATWITEEMLAAYVLLHRLGHARSVEVWLEDELVGGLYGIDLPEKKVFCGESMFSKVSNASKIGFYHWVEYLKDQGYRLIDCQVYTSHLERLGAREIPRSEFLDYL